MIAFIQKRNGEKVPFEEGKIQKAIRKAILAVGRDEETSTDLSFVACALTLRVLNEQGFSASKVPTVEQVQDCVETALVRANLPDVAKAYIVYRKKREISRKSSRELNEQLREIFDVASVDSDLKRDNANVDGDTAMGTMLQVGAAASKSFYAETFLTDKEREAHQSGDIHIHDFDFYALTTTCCQIDFKRLADRGFSTGHGYIRPPQSVQSYAALACIAIQSNQNDQHGGQAIPNFDYAMADGVRKTFRKELLRMMVNFVALDGMYSDDEQTMKSLERFCEDALCRMEHSKGETVGLSNVHDWAVELGLELLPGKPTGVLKVKMKHIVARAIRETEKATHQAMESLLHNLNTMHSRAGAQTPFSSLNYGTDTSPEGRMVIRQLLLATLEGLGDGETPIFPIQIFKVKEGVNYNEGDPNYDLFKLSMKVSAKRLFPNYVFLDAPFNLQYYVPGRPETEVATMGCRTRVMGNIHNPATIDENGVYHPNGEIAYGRGNLSFTSINLPRLAILADGDVDAFYMALQEKMELVFQQLLHRFEVQSRRHIYNYPFLMGQGVWMGSESLSAGEPVKEVLKNGTLSIGFIGLAETLTALYGHHHGENDEMQEKGLEIIRYMRAYCDLRAKETRLNFSLLATPAEGLSGYFVKKDRALFGVIPGVTDREYYTNSFHIPVWYPITAYDKIRKEAPYHALTNAGHISYVELDGDTANNLEAFESVVRCMHDSGIGYGSINHPVDQDPVCGYVGIIGDTCPQCGRKVSEPITEEFLNRLKEKRPNAPIFRGV